MTSVVQVDSLFLRYPSGTIALENLTLDVRRGEIFGLLGLNGAGKSSLIKTIATLLRPMAGRVHVFGLDARSRSAEIKRRIGVVPQENNLDTDLDVRQNLLFHCRYAGVPARIATLRVDDWLMRLGLEDKAHESVLHLSGGSKRKVMLVKAFLTAPELLILDEPGAGLDLGVRARLWDEVWEFRKQGGTVFLSTHYIDEAEQLCDRIGILHQGRLVTTLAAGRGEKADRYACGAMVEAFNTAVGATA